MVRQLVTAEHISTQYTSGDTKQMQGKHERTIMSLESLLKDSLNTQLRSTHTNTRARTNYREDASSRPVEGDAVHGRQVSQDPLVHLHVLVHGRGHQLPETVGAIQPAPEARLDWTAKTE